MFKETLPANCPPPQAIEQEITLFRIFENDSISENEFIPHTRKYPDNPKHKKDCAAYGVSLFTSYEKALAKYSEILSQYNKKMGSYIAEVIIKPEYGKIKITEASGHCNLWLYSKVEVEKIETKRIVAIEQ